MERIEKMVIKRKRDIGGMEVRRELKKERRRIVGKLIFLERMGKEIMSEGEEIDVRKNKNIGI